MEQMSVPFILGFCACYTIVYFPKYISSKYEKVSSLYDSLKSIYDNDGRLSLLYKTIMTVYKKTTNDIKSLFFGVKYIKSNRYIVSYFMGDSIYKIVLLKNKIFNSIKKSTIIENSEEIDVTDIIKKYAGPNLDFHNVYVTPEMIGLSDVRVKMFDNKEYFFRKDLPLSFY